MLKAIHAQEDKAAALAKGRDVVEKLRMMKLAKAANLVAESLDETLSYMKFPRNIGGGSGPIIRWNGS